jgi:hypothetical protein
MNLGMIPRSLLVYQGFGGTYCRHLQSREESQAKFYLLHGFVVACLDHLEDGVGTFRRNIGKYLPGYSISHSGRE